MLATTKSLSPTEADIQLLILDWSLYVATTYYLRAAQDVKDKLGCARVAEDFSAISDDILNTLTDLDTTPLKCRIQLYRLASVVLNRPRRKAGSESLTSIIPTFLSVGGWVLQETAAADATDDAEPYKILDPWYDLFLELQIQAGVEDYLYGGKSPEDCCKSLCQHDVLDDPVLAKGIKEKSYQRYTRMKEKAWKEKLQGHPSAEFDEMMIQYVAAVADIMGVPVLTQYQECTDHPDLRWLTCSPLLGLKIGDENSVKVEDDR
ncbi:uncharacterized protein SPPG_01398 [Spizellomyces punctatus DAOM BR117]|uniref:Uncharacterized protein n=1 Tax=Spizellomyces punctatus (strain DAOM BR117) TaxID=645134 RepID=A0A0L0HS87_SPIPD|nr:uncharacterized protein SPPG_01398 [Spizellomyces punctatus DAOM BR117]KND03947.1 hypothetical protein SPPG_01398 [Spizellomyces punctatus DAOM BR117]|eukprot:XP_016611986.1 hypothetical protein SPPG_01398 [Spizellomyces punctatus DAOM BR117]